MLQFLKRWFRAPGRPTTGGSDERRLAILERLAVGGEDTPEAAPLFNRLADLELSAGNQRDAVQYYGKSVDVYVELRQFDSATAVCRKLLRVLPGVVRARCTLAWLSLRKGHLDIARRHVDDYVEAARQAGTSELAAQQLLLMARYSTDPGIRAHLALKLRAVGDEDGALEVERGDFGTLSGSGDLWDPVVFATLLTPEELREAEEKGLEIRVSEEGEEGGDDSLPMYRPPGV